MTTREILERPFPPELIRHRPGRNGEDIVYVEATTIIARLNEAYGGEWSFTIDQHEILDDEVVVLGRLLAGGITKASFGSSAITRTRDGGKPVSIGDDLKAAATDALKKATTLLGVGVHLNGNGNGADRPSPAPTSEPKVRTNGNGALSAAQLKAIHAIRRRAGWSDAELGDFSKRVTQVADVEKLDKKSASMLIDRLQAEAAPAGAAR